MAATDALRTVHFGALLVQVPQVAANMLQNQFAVGREALARWQLIEDGHANENQNILLATTKRLSPMDGVAIHHGHQRGGGPALPGDERALRSLAVVARLTTQRACRCNGFASHGIRGVIPATADNHVPRVATARDHISMDCFILQDIVGNDAHQSVSELRIERMQRGAAVNIIYDGFGSADTPAAFFDRLRKAGARIVEFNPLNPLMGAPVGGQSIAATARFSSWTDASVSPAASISTRSARIHRLLASPPMAT